MISWVMTSISASLLSVSSKLVRAAFPWRCLKSVMRCLMVNISVLICSLKSTYLGGIAAASCEEVEAPFSAAPSAAAKSLSVALSGKRRH